MLVMQVEKPNEKKKKKMILSNFPTLDLHSGDIKVNNPISMILNNNEINNLIIFTRAL